MFGSPSSPSERRQTQRTKLVEIAYIGMGPENGGLVLDVSDGGLSFHSVAPVQQDETINFLLSLRGHSRIEGTGVVVWTSKLNTVCGMKFTALSDGAREHLNNWTLRSKTIPAKPKPPRAEIVAPAASTAMAEAQSEAGITSAAIVATPAPATDFSAPVDFISPVMLSVPEEASLWRKPLFAWTIFFILASTLSVAAFFYGIQVGRSQKGAAGTAASSAAPSNSTSEQPASRSALLPAADDAPPAAAEALPEQPSAPVPAPTTKGTFVNASKTDNSSSAVALNPDSDASAGQNHAQRAGQNLETGESQLAAAQAYLRGDSGPRDSAKAAKLLWSAVGNGNSAAEVLLADLYLLGDGVVKSCEQGRVLLGAAAKSGNTEAQEKLDELTKNGCQ